MVKNAKKNGKSRGKNAPKRWLTSPFAPQKNSTLHENGGDASFETPVGAGSCDDRTFGAGAGTAALGPALHGGEAGDPIPLHPLRDLVLVPRCAGRGWGGGRTLEAPFGNAGKAETAAERPHVLVWRPLEVFVSTLA